MCRFGKHIVAVGLLSVCLSASSALAEKNNLNQVSFESEKTRRVLFNIQFKLEALGYTVERNGRWDAMSQAAANQFSTDYGVELNSSQQQLLLFLQQAEAGKLKRSAAITTASVNVVGDHLALDDVQSFGEISSSVIEQNPAPQAESGAIYTLRTPPVVLDFSYLKDESGLVHEEAKHKQDEPSKVEVSAEEKSDSSTQPDNLVEPKLQDGQVNASELVSALVSKEQRLEYPSSPSSIWPLLWVLIGGVGGWWLIRWLTSDLNPQPIRTAQIEQVDISNKVIDSDSFLVKPVAHSPSGVAKRLVDQKPLGSPTIDENKRPKDDLSADDSERIKKIVRAIETSQSLNSFASGYCYLPLKPIPNKLTPRIGKYFKQHNKDPFKVFSCFLDYYAEQVKCCFLEKSTDIAAQATPVWLLEHEHFPDFWKKEATYRYYVEGYPPDWSVRRELVLMREAAHCQRCGVLVELKLAHIHHISPKSVSHYHGLDNLAFLCKDCHSCMPSNGHLDIRGEAIYYFSERQKLHTADCRYRGNKAVKGKASDYDWLEKYTYCKQCDPLGYHERLVKAWEPTLVRVFKKQQPAIIRELMNGTL